MFENRVLRRIFGPKRDEVTGEWRKLHNEELTDLYSPNIITFCIWSLIRNSRNFSKNTYSYGTRATGLFNWR